MRLFFRRFRRHIRSHRHWWARLLLWLLYGVAKIVAFVIDLLTQIVASATASAFRATFSGSVTAILAKVCGWLLFFGLLAVSVGAHELANALIVLMVLPIMLLGLAVMVRSAFRRS